MSKRKDVAYIRYLREKIARPNEPEQTISVSLPVGVRVDHFQNLTVKKVSDEGMVTCVMEGTTETIVFHVSDLSYI